MSDSYAAGRQAFHAGLKRTDCPHDGGPRRREWQDGFDDAKAENAQWEPGDQEPEDGD